MYVHNSVNNTPHNYDDEDINDPAVTLISKQDLSHPLHLHSNDSATLIGNNKTAFIDGSYKRSNTDEVLGRKWNRVNAVVFRAKHVWEELKETYDKVDGSKQFDALVELPRCTCHAAVDFKKHNQLMKLMQFLTGLDNTYMQIKSSILSIETLLDFRNAYAIISNKESHMIASSNLTETSQRPNDNRNRRTAGGSNLVYEERGFNGHTIDRCCKIIGYPPDFGKKKAGQNNKGKNISNNVVGSISFIGFFDEQLSTLMSLIKENSMDGKGVQDNMTGFERRESSGDLLGHLVDQVLDVLRPNLLFENNKSNVDIFPFKQKVDIPTETSVLELNSLNFFDFHHIDDHPDIPNDEERSDPSPNRYGTPSPHSGSTFDHSQGFNAVASEDESFEPKSFEEASKHQHWVEAMNSKMDALD
ncbi:hypothetical protein Tco_1398982, partial [Tanacetum coccineum]